ncbi:MAG TPA: energy transducer TonB [Woeseiaceae bacterium]|nr:energy transducer TonB [Woeseiaceae bacterium]
MIDAFADIDLAEGRAPALQGAGEAKPDRLPPMLFLAALIHGILIIGITFNPLARGESRAISLDVTIVADPERTAANAEDADYLAQTSQDGQGNTLLEVRPGALPESNVPFDNAGQPGGDSLETTQAAVDAADQVLTSRAEQDLAVPDRPREEPETREQAALALEAGVELTLPLPQDEAARLQIHDDNPRELVTSVDTREAVIAGYLYRWKQKIEAIGVAYFPEQALAQGHTGSPTLEVTIDASGELQEVVIRRSSGSRVLDQAALDILRRAAPFDPFPEAVSADYDQLRFAYKWEFVGARLTGDRT